MRILRIWKVVSIALLLMTCVDYESEKTNLDVRAAQNWFEANQANLSMINNSKSGRISSSFRKIPDWRNSKVHRAKNGMKVVEVALDYDVYLLATEKEIRNSTPNVINTLLLFEIRPGEYRAYLFKIYPENSEHSLTKNDFKKLNYGQIPANFSGRAMVFDWDETFIGGWQIEDGKRTKFIGKLPNGQKTSLSNKGGRIVCYQITTYWYSQACGPSGGCAAPVLIDVTYSVSCEYSLAPGDDSGSQGPGDPNENTCFVQHSFIAGLMIPCSTQVPCTNGYLRNWNGECVCPSSSMEVINGNCVFKCLSGLTRNAAGECVTIQNCNTSDPIANAIQSELEQIWRESNASHSSVPMQNRTEAGRWIVRQGNGYATVPFPSGWKLSPCGIDGNLNPGDIPANVVGMVHSHPFYVGEDTRGVCGTAAGEASYKGGPSPDDYITLIQAMNTAGNFNLTSYVIDGANISSIGLGGAASLKQYGRCGY